ncbi:MAG: hypothetical protein ACI4OP_08325 [Candidatus Coprovivens sp.]
MNFVSSHPAFNDTIDSLRNEFKDDKSNNVIICGAHDFSRTQSIDLYKKKFDKVIVFNQEPLTATQRQFMHKGYFAWLKQADEVWDYDEQNIEVLKLIRSDVKLHILKPYKDWSVYKPVAKDIDILFYGSMNEHRAKILNELKKKYKVVVLQNAWGTILDNYIMRSKILLNLHFYYESSMQEQARMIRWIGSTCRIVSEKSWKNYLGVEEIEDWNSL